MAKPYTLEIYLPDSPDDVVATFESDMPFQAISVGDLINPQGWPGSHLADFEALRVTGVEHIVWESRDEIKHKVMLFTRAVPDTRATRTGA